MDQREKRARQWTTLPRVIQVAGGASAQTTEPGGFPARQHPSGGHWRLNCRHHLYCWRTGYICLHLCLPQNAQMCKQLRAFWGVCLTFFARRKWDQLCQRQPVYTLSLNNGRGAETAENGYHGKADICLLEGGAVVGPVSRHCHHLSGFAHRAIDDT